MADTYAFDDAENWLLLHTPSGPRMIRETDGRSPVEAILWGVQRVVTDGHGIPTSVETTPPTYAALMKETDAWYYLNSGNLRMLTAFGPLEVLPPVAHG